MPHIEISSDRPLFDTSKFGFKFPINDTDYRYFDGDVTIVTQVLLNPINIIIVPKVVFEEISASREIGKLITIRSGNKPLFDPYERVGPRRKGQVVNNGKPVGNKGYTISSIDIVIS